MAANMGNLKKLGLARISHQPTAAGAYLPESTALGSDKGLDVLTSTPACFVSLASCISVHLRALASRSGEKCGLVVGSLTRLGTSLRAAHPVPR